MVILHTVRRASFTLISLAGKHVVVSGPTPRHIIQAEYALPVLGGLTPAARLSGTPRPAAPPARPCREWNSPSPPTGPRA